MGTGICLSRCPHDPEGSLESTIQRAVKLSAALQQVHEKGIVHGHLNPGCILVDLDTESLCLSGSGSFHFQNHPPKAGGNPDIPVPAETLHQLAYISPEQTGRLSCPLDYRSDLYSLGVIFFELLIGRPPFISDDAAQIIHGHLAKDPFATVQIDREIPSALIHIVQRLLEKEPSRRYSSAENLKNDLKNCLRQLTASGKIDPFPLDRAGMARTFRFSRAFYGRTQELARLHEIYRQQGRRQAGMVFVSGLSGIGKTAFVEAFCNEIQKQDHPFTMCISGKYDQVRRDIPHFALVEALKVFVRQCAAKKGAEFEQVKKEILAGIGQNGRLIIDLVPDLELLIGPQPELPRLDIVEARNRFFTTLIRFLGAIVNRRRKIILFLDDLQWVDAESLSLLRRILDQAIPDLFMIGAFRKEEVPSGHIFQTFMDEMAGAEMACDHMEIGPLNKSVIAGMIADASKTDLSSAVPLAQVVFDRTGGNPFQIKEYAHSLFHLNYLKYDGTHEYWQWDIARMKEIGKTTSLDALTKKRISALGDTAVSVLQAAACLGNRFSCRELSIVCGKSLQPIEAVLEQAAAHGLVRADEEGGIKGNDDPDQIQWFQFVHDGIQLSVYQMIPGSEQTENHLNIGRRLFQAISDEAEVAQFLSATAQMNLGRPAIKTETEKAALAKINLEAAQVAEKTAAYQTALTYVKTGIELLGQQAWQQHYDLTLELYNEALESSFLCLEYDRVDSLFQAVMHHARTELDKMKAYEVRIRTYMSIDALPEAIETARKALARLGEKIPKTIHNGHILSHLLLTKIRMRNRPTETLADLPDMENPKAVAAVQIYSQVWHASYICAPRLALLFMLKIFLLTLRYGNPAQAPFIYACYSIVLCSISGNIAKGLEFAKLATDLLDRKAHQGQAVKTRFVVNCHANIWQHHPKKDLQQLKDGLETGLAAGDFQFAAASIHLYCGHSFYAGRPLQELEVEMRKASQEIKTLQQEAPLYVNCIFHQTVLNLLGASSDPCRLEGEVYSEQKMLAGHQAANNENAICITFLNKMRLGYLFGEFEAAVEHSRKAEKHLDAVRGLLLIQWFYFYDSLAHIAVYNDQSPEKQKSVLARVNANLKKMKKWAEIVPVNHAHTCLLVQAEKARIQGQTIQADRLYNQAIERANQNDYIHEEALAWELAARFHEIQGQAALAGAYLGRALACYKKWGAAAKVGHLKENSAHLLNDAGLMADQSGQPNSRPQENFDLSSMIKASETIAKETMLSRLMDKLMTIVMENAGARKGFLILRGSRGWNVTARVVAGEVHDFSPVPLDECKEVPVSMIRYVKRSGRDIVLDHAAGDSRYQWDQYVREKQLKSALCIPIFYQGDVNGVLYLENNAIAGVFTLERVDVLKNVSRIVANAWARDQAEKEVLQYQDQLRSLSSQLLIAEEKERRSMAVALHDNIGHALFSAVMELDKLKGEAGENFSPRLETIRSILDQSIKDTHTLTFELSPPLLYDLGLAAALAWLADKTSEQYEIPVVFTDRGTRDEIDESMAILLFQSVRELLFNMAKHARASRADISMKSDGFDLEIVVADDGKGFDVSEKDFRSNARGGFGLFSIQERLGSQGGYMEIDSGAGQGSRIAMVVPLGHALEHEQMEGPPS